MIVVIAIVAEQRKKIEWKKDLFRDFGGGVSVIELPFGTRPAKGGCALIT
ncbi:hypothetical protein [Pelagimonas phthalicica]|nr:hypothetical protein [Pelagimonas phthalicica]